MLVNELKPEEIKAVAVLKDLSEDAIKAIVNLSQTVVTRTTKTNWDDLDREIEEATGKKKEGGVKSLVFMKGLLKNADADAKKEYEDKITALESEKAALTTKLNASSGKEAENKIADLEQQIADKTSEIESLKTVHATKLKEATDKYESEQAANIDLAVSQSISEGMSGVKLKAGFTEDIVKDVLKSRQSAAYGTYTRHWQGEGKDRRIIFRDPNNDNEIVRDPENNNEPATPFGLLSKGITDLVDPGRKVKGAGGKVVIGKKDDEAAALEYLGDGLDMDGVKSQVDADARITKYIATQEGLTKMDPAFQERHTAIREEHGVAELPIRESA